MKVCPVFEHSCIQYDPHLQWYKDGFKKCHYEALVTYHDHHGGDKYFSLIRSGVKFSQYVGVIQVQDLTIEILPKTDKHVSDTNTWHNVLLGMLRQTRFLQLDYQQEASLRYRQHSILHLYFMEYLRQVEHLIQLGLIKKYRQQEGNLNVLKGSLRFNQHLSKNLIHKERFYTRHQVYDRQHLLHQILYEALLILHRFTKDSYISDKLNRVLFQFPEVPRKRITEKTFETLSLDRKAKPYKRALEIAKMIILNYSPDIKGGNNDLFALLFDMNDLWEEYIYRQLLRAGVDVKFQESELFWESRRMRPDMIVRDGKETFVLDTKWKIVNDGKPSDEDLRQVFAYNIYWGARKGFLIYPKTLYSPETRAGIYHQGHKEGSEKMTCLVVYVDVLDGEQLNPEVGAALKEKIFKAASENEVDKN